MTHPLTIQSATVSVVGPQVERLRFSTDMGEVYESLTILEITTADGGTGLGGVTLFSENTFDTSLGESLKTLLPALIGRSAENPPAIFSYMHGRYNAMTPAPQGLIDIAVWDRLAKARQLPLHRLLGSERESLPAYASIPLLESPAAYLDMIESLSQDNAFDAFKVHVWCDPGRDIELIQALAGRFGHRFKFIVDLEERYTFDETVQFLQSLVQLDCLWLEAPLPDTDLDGYRALRNSTEIPIVPAGNTLDSLGLLRLGIAHQAWDALRVDANFAGGITPVREMIEVGASHGLPTELQAWGYTLSQATNLHLSLASPNVTYFELPVPYPPREACAKQGFRAVNGRVTAPEGFGLGIEVDWDAVQFQLLDRYFIS